MPKFKYPADIYSASAAATGGESAALEPPAKYFRRNR
jgi:hypothetical protein